ncbi:50S ribosomal protein L6, partial [Candidatus Saccharibacteria bacterium]|nr:50S ribosomal protein L6 [Candidatus Saccharibacteria bacterium]
LVKNAIQGVSGGFRKELELVGVGYKAVVEGGVLRLTLGYSHPVEYRFPKEVGVTVEGGTRIIIEGVDKQKVGQVAAEIREKRPPEPYKGKGIRYVGEVVRRKHGKAMKAAVVGT